MNRLLTLLLMFAFTAVVLAPASAQDEKKADEPKAAEPKAEEPKAEEPKAPETKVAAKNSTQVVPMESTWQARAKAVGAWWPLISLVLFGGLFFLIVRLRSDLNALQEKVQG